MSEPYIPDIDPKYDLLFISREERERLIIEAEWPGGLKPISTHNILAIRKLHPSYDDLAKRYATPEAYRKVLHSTYLDLLRGKMIGVEDIDNCELPQFIEPADRLYLYIIKDKDNIPSGCLFERTHLQWYISKDHPDASQLMQKYGTKKAKTNWHVHKKTTSDKRKKKLKNGAQLISELGKSAPRIVYPRGPKRKSKMVLDSASAPLRSMSDLVLKMFEARVKKGLINKKTPKQTASKMIADDLLTLGERITPSMVLKHLNPCTDEPDEYDQLLKKHSSES